MFHRTIYQNLKIAKIDACDNEIIAACKKAKIHDDIMAMKNGYNSVVGETLQKLQNWASLTLLLKKIIYIRSKELNLPVKVESKEYRCPSSSFCSAQVLQQIKHFISTAN